MHGPHYKLPVKINAQIDVIKLLIAQKANLVQEVMMSPDMIMTS